VRVPSFTVPRAPLVSPAARLLAALGDRWVPSVGPFRTEPPAHDPRIAVDSAPTMHAEVVPVTTSAIF
jgi:hypothetical protein